MGCTNGSEDKQGTSGALSLLTLNLLAGASVIDNGLSFLAGWLKK